MSDQQTDAGVVLDSCEVNTNTVMYQNFIYNQDFATNSNPTCHIFVVKVHNYWTNHHNSLLNVFQIVGNNFSVETASDKPMSDQQTDVGVVPDSREVDTNTVMYQNFIYNQVFATYSNPTCHILVVEEHNYWANHHNSLLDIFQIVGDSFSVETASDKPMSDQQTGAGVVADSREVDTNTVMYQSFIFKDFSIAQTHQGCVK